MLGRFKIIFTDYQNYKGYKKSVDQIIKNQNKVTKITVNQIAGQSLRLLYLKYFSGLEHGGPNVSSRSGKLKTKMQCFM